jgi:hypothetical protein
MKAKEYANKYIPLLAACTNEEERKKVLSDLFKEFMGEIQQLTITRHISPSSPANIALINEGSQKWRALCGLLPNKELKENGFRDLWISKVPELEKYLR